jgi:hypothetical protein
MVLLYILVILGIVGATIYVNYYIDERVYSNKKEGE